VAEGTRLLAEAGEERTVRRPTGGGWTAREVIGHLIDSACNNHRRFVVNQHSPRLVIDPYEQDAWVSLGRYADTPAADLVRLWSAYNLQMARVLEAIPDEVLNQARGPLADYRFSYIAQPATEYATLGYLADDYVAHIQHHLSQISSLLVQ
jgi:hypothetical protein